MALPRYILPRRWLPGILVAPAELIVVVRADRWVVILKAQFTGDQFWQ
ncbi:hypothetical protein NMD69_07260 [Edwardsiella tarda]